MMFLVGLTALLLSLALPTSAQNQTCPPDSQPAIFDVSPPSGTTGINFTVSGQNLEQVRSVSLQQPGVDISITDIQINDAFIRFLLPSAAQGDIEEGLATLLLVANATECLNVTVDIYLLRRNIFYQISENNVQPGTILSTSNACLPPDCGDNSTSYDVIFLENSLEILEAEDFRFRVRFPDTNTTFEDAALSIMSLYTLFPSGASVNFFPPSPITSVTPSSGQRGTRVEIEGDDLLGRGAGTIKLRQVILGSSPADIEEESRALIRVRVNTGTPGSTTLNINTTQMMFDSDGPYTYNNSLWTQLEDGIVTDIIPPAAQPGVNITIVGARLAGGGEDISTITVAEQSASVFSGVQRNQNDTNDFITVQVPSLSDGTTGLVGGVMITADTGAIVESLPGVIFSFASIETVVPSQGQVGAIINISGIQLLSGYELEPVVTLSGVQATVMSSSNGSITVQAGDPSTVETSGSGIDPSTPNTTGDVVITVTITTDQSFSLTATNVWRYRDPGEIILVDPNSGQFGTQISVSGNSLLAYGDEIVRALIDGVEAEIVSQADDLVVLIIPDVSTIGDVDIVLESSTGAEVRGEGVFENRERGSIISVAPDSGQSGTYVNITGNNLFGYGDNITMVTFGDIEAEIDYTVTTNNLIRVRVRQNDVIIDTGVAIVITATTSAIVHTNNNAFTYLVPGRISSVSPSNGQDGTMVEINGTNLFGGGSSVQSILLDGVLATVDTQSDTSITVTMHGLSEQQDIFRNQVYIISDTGAMVIGGDYEHMVSGQITDFDPRTGRDGTTIRVVGDNLLGYGAGIVNVEIAGVRGALVEVISSSEVRVEAGAGVGGQVGPISLTSNTGAIVSSTPDTVFTYQAMGIITDVTPAEGGEGSGVLITGMALQPEGTFITNVTIGGTQTSRIVTTTDTTISVLVGLPPVVNSSNVSVEITASDGSSVIGGNFSYITLNVSLPLRNQGQQGTLVQIQLPDDPSFSPSLPLLAEIGGEEAEIVGMSVAEQYINVTVPRASQPGTYMADVSVQANTGRVARLRDGFTYLPEGVIFSVTPNSGQRETRVTLRGENLFGGGQTISTIHLGNIGTTEEVMGEVISESDDEIEFRIVENLPAGTNFPLTGDILLTADTGATTTRLSGFTFVQPGRVSGVEPSMGQFGTSVTISGSDLLQGGTFDNITSITLAGREVLNTNFNGFREEVVVVAAGDGPQKTGPIIITLITGAQIISPDDITFEYLAPGEIVKLTPNRGTVGTRVTITGFGLLAGGMLPSVTLGGVTAMVVGQPNDNTISVIAQAPPSAPDVNNSYSGVVEITVNTDAAVNGSFWTFESLGVIESVSPIQGQRGVRVTATGTSLLGSSATNFTACSLAGIVGEVISATDTNATCEAGFNSSSGLDSDSSMLSGPLQLTADSGPILTSQQNFTYYVAFIDSLVPDNGTNGTLTTIQGKNLVSYPGGDFQVDSITIGGQPVLEIGAVSVGRIEVRAAFSNASTSNDVIITSSSGALLVGEGLWEYTEPGEVTSVLPTTAPPGETVIITGSNLVPPCVSDVQIIVGQTPSYTATVINTSSIEFRPGPYQAMPGSSEDLDTPLTPLPIQILSSNGATVVSSNVEFQYNTSLGRVTSISPLIGSAGTNVTIIGTNLLNNASEAMRVTLAGKEATIISSSNTQVTVMAGEGPDEGGVGSVVIESSNTTVTGIGGNVWRYLPVVTSSNVNPQSGQNGTVVALDLKGILNTLTLRAVILVDTEAQVNNTNGNVVTVQAGPRESGGQGDIRVEFEEDAVLIIPVGWTYENPVIVNDISPAAGYYNSKVTINGENFEAGGVTISSVFVAGLATTIMSQNDTTIVVRLTKFNNSSSAPLQGPVVIYSSFGAAHVSDNQFTYIQVRVDSVSPQQGQEGTRVTITGVGLLAGSPAGSEPDVQLRGVTAMMLISSSDSMIELRAGPLSNQSSIGDIVYTLTTGATVEVANVWRYLPPGEVTSIEPSQGQVGEYVTLRGQGMLQGGSSIASMRFGSTEVLEVVAASDNYILVRLGMSSSVQTPLNAVIEADTGALLESVLTFQYLEPGNVSMFDPMQGQNGTEVTLTGINFNTVGATIARITLAGVEATVISTTEGTSATIEAGRPDILGSFSGPVVVESNTRALVFSANNFTYFAEGGIYAVEPAKGRGGSEVTISGEGLLGGGTELSAVYLAGIEANFTTSETSNTSVTVTASNTDIMMEMIGDIVLVSNSGAYVRRIDGWTYVQAGSVSSIEPPEGQYGTMFTITGSGLLSGGQSISDVIIGGVSAYKIVSSNDTMVVARAGQTTEIDGFTGQVILVSNSGGRLQTGMEWTYLRASRISTVLPNSGTSNTMVTITGDNLLGDGNNIVSLTTAGVQAMSGSINFFGVITVTFRTGVNQNGSGRQGDIVIEADTGARTVMVDGWTYLDDCPSGEFGIFGNCAECDSECIECTGPSNENCVECATFSIPLTGSLMMRCVSQCPNVSSLDNVCLDACDINQYVRVDSSSEAKFCYDCHPLCHNNFSCSGPLSTECEQCEFVYDRSSGACTESCQTETFQNEENICIPCDVQCLPQDGCSGSSNTDCTTCRNVRVSASLIPSMGSTPDVAELSDVCLQECPLDSYLSNATQDCLLCNAQCRGGCGGPTAFDCNFCSRFSTIESDSIRCVATCNPDVSRITMYDDLDGFCQSCSDLCSLEGGCRGPTASDCVGCRNDSASNTVLPQFDGECVLSCPNTSTPSSGPLPTRFYYANLVTGNCELCHGTCTDGCTGSAAEDCTVKDEEDSESLFSAGGGTIGIFVAIIVAIVIAALLIAVMIYLCTKKSKNKYTMDDEVTVRATQNIELGDQRYQVRPGETSFTSPNEKAAVEKTKGAANAVFETDSDFYYSPMSPTDPVVQDLKAKSLQRSQVQGPVVMVEEKYQEVPKSTVISNEDAELYVEPGAEVTPARPPKLDDVKAEQEQKGKPPIPVPYKTSEKAEQPPYRPPKPTSSSQRPPAPEPVEPELYTDMEASVTEVRLQPNTMDEEYSEMTNLPDAATVEDFYEDTSAVALGQGGGGGANNGDTAPLIDDDMYEDTETTRVEYERVKQAMASNQAPKLPSQPIPKKRLSVPLPETPLEKSLQDPTDIYEEAEPMPVQESLYEAIPGMGGRMAEAPPSPQEPQRQGRKGPSSNAPPIVPRGRK